MVSYVRVRGNVGATRQGQRRLWSDIESRKPLHLTAWTGHPNARGMYHL